MPDLISDKLIGKSTQQEHHKIAAKLQAMSDEWDRIELDTGVRPPEAYDYSFGIVLGQIIFNAPQNKITDLRQKIILARSIV